MPRKHLFCLLTTVLLATQWAIPPASAAVPTTDRKVARLSEELELIGRLDRRQRRVGALGLLAVGTAALAAGTYMLIRNGSDPVISSDSAFTLLPAAAVGIGAAFDLIGGLLLLGHGAYSDDWRTSLNLGPQATADERLQAMESVLRESAQKERSQRIIGAVLGLVIAAGGTAAYFAADRTPGNQIFLYLGALGLADGILAAAQRGLREGIWDDYRSWAASDGDAPNHAAAGTPSVRLSLFPQRDGAGAGLALAL